ncbi:MAG TPA: response regulator transcription factor [Candidatus Fournierella merdigallinarum]|nr:response regulator transcription factor [Candidatus Fournierella merdigallinarum]
MITILIADDFDLLRQDMTELINAQPDMQVVGQASTGAGLVELAKNVKSDMILMDIEMENVSAGIQAAEAVRELDPDRMILYLTAHDTDRMILTAMGTGAVDYIVKGADDQTVLAHIRAAAAGRPMLDAKIQATVMREYSRLRRSEQSLLFFINNVSQLTATERELVRLLLQDKKVRDIAAARCVEVVTVKTQIKGLLHKFGCTRTKEIVELIRQLNISHLF